MTKRRSGAEPALGSLVEAAKGLAHPLRLRLLAMLASGELCVCQMTAAAELAPSTISQHLAVLARGGWVAERKSGRLVFYRLRDDGLTAELLPRLFERLAGDPLVRQDRALVARLRRVGVAELCAAELDLAAIGVRRGGALAAGVAS